jgi:uncharacterized protein
MTVALVVMAKAPVPGLAKTRIGNVLGADAAAQLQRAMILDCLHREWPVSRKVIAWSGQSDLWQHARDLNWECTEQIQGDLGQRMQSAVEGLLPDSDRVIVLGTDTPDVPDDIVHFCLSVPVDEGPAFGPAADGGYWCVVFGKPHFCVFNGVEWSTDTVLSDSLSLALAAGLRPHLLPWWADVDTVADLRRLRLHSDVPSCRDRPRLALHTLRLLQSPSFAAIIP